MKQRPDWLRRPEWLNRRNVAKSAVGLFVLAIFGGLIYLGYQEDASLFSGFGPGEVETTSEKTDNQGQIIERTTTKIPQEAKTLWDWTNLAGVVAVPLLLAWFGFRLQNQQQKQNEAQKQRELEQAEKLAATQREQTEKLAAVEREVAEQNRQEEALQTYFDRISSLLVEKNLLAISAKVAKKDQKAGEAPTDSATGDTATPEEEELLDVSVNVIRARTLTTLRRLGSTRKTSLIQFLLEAEVINKLQLSLQGADLAGANLRAAKLAEADLKLAILKEADLFGANLIKADLVRANLVRADLQLAILKEANLFGANLAGADLKLANLVEAELPSADLAGAKLNGARLQGANLNSANLAGANLAGANLEGTNLSEDDLKEAKLCRTKLPKGINLNPDRDCERRPRGFPALD